MHGPPYYNTPETEEDRELKAYRKRIHDLSVKHKVLSSYPFEFLHTQEFFAQAACETIQMLRKAGNDKEKQDEIWNELQRELFSVAKMMIRLEDTESPTVADVQDSLYDEVQRSVVSNLLFPQEDQSATVDTTVVTEDLRQRTDI